MNFDFYSIILLFNPKYFIAFDIQNFLSNNFNSFIFMDYNLLSLKNLKNKTINTFFNSFKFSIRLFCIIDFYFILFNLVKIVNHFKNHPWIYSFRLFFINLNLRLIFCNFRLNLVLWSYIRCKPKILYIILNIFYELQFLATFLLYNRH